MGRRAGIVEGGKNPRWATFFDQVAYDLIVEILNRSPLDFLPNVFFLFSLEGEFDEDLLQLLVDVIDAELFERVILKSRFSKCTLYAYRNPKPRRSRNRRYPVDPVEVQISHVEGRYRTRIPISWVMVPRGFIDTFTLDTIHSKRLE